MLYVRKYKNKFISKEGENWAIKQNGYKAKYLDIRLPARFRLCRLSQLERGSP